MILPRWNMVEGGTAHDWERSTDQLVCLEVPPALVYKEARGERRPAKEGAPRGESYSHRE